MEYCFRISQGVFTPGGSGDFFTIKTYDDFMEACFKFVEVCNDLSGYKIFGHDTLDTILEVETYDEGDLLSVGEGILYTQFNRRGRLVFLCCEDVVPELIIDKIISKEE